MARVTGNLLVLMLDPRRQRVEYRCAALRRYIGRAEWAMLGHGERLKKPVPKTNASSGASAETADALTRYRDMRDPLRTNEPFGAEHKQSARETRMGRFVVHLHDATRPHYDVRLQIGGTLKSFAVPRGPSLEAGDKKLAVLTEDHPLEYLDFEEIIPDGNYGAGAMIAWDVGRVRYLETTAERGLEIGKLDFELDGFKLHGRFALVATGRRKATGPNDKKANEWLLIKKQDAFAHPQGDVLSLAAVQRAVRAHACRSLRSARAW